MHRAEQAEGLLRDAYVGAWVHAGGTP
jgi:hypothetical protein